MAWQWAQEPLHGLHHSVKPAPKCADTVSCCRRRRHGGHVPACACCDSFPGRREGAASYFHSAQRAEKREAWGKSKLAFQPFQSTTFNRCSAGRAFSAVLWTVNAQPGQGPLSLFPFLFFFFFFRPCGVAPSALKIKTGFPFSHAPTP